jgi:hypothetical protein
MKRVLLLIGVVAMVIWARRIAAPPKIHADEGCTNASLNGAYGYSQSGFFYGPNLGIFGGMGRFVADGNGALTGADTLSIDGSAVRRKYTGTYSIASDCTGSIVFQIGSGTTNFDVVLNNNGQEVNLVETDSNTIITGTAHQQIAAKP